MELTIYNTDNLPQHGSNILPDSLRCLIAPFAGKNLRRMMRFAAVYDDEKIVVPLMRQLAWTHSAAPTPIADTLKRSFYEQPAIVEHWSVRTLSNKNYRRQRHGTATFRRFGTI